MNILIVGAGKVGSNLAIDMVGKGHKVKIVEKDEFVCKGLIDIKNVEIVFGDGCDPLILEYAGIKMADIVIAVTGDDEDNLVIAQLAKLQQNKPKVVSVINNPRNEWLFKKSWGIDAAESPTSIILKLIEKDIDNKNNSSVI